MAVLLAQHRASSSSSPTPLQSDCDGPLLPPVPEPLLLRDILYLFQGIDGEFVRFRTCPPPRAGPKRTFFVGLAGSGYSLPAPTRALLHQLSELGWLYRKIDAALGKKPVAPVVVGMVEQSLHAELKKEMTEYFRLVAVLEAKLEGVEDDEGTAGGGQALEGLTQVESLSGGLTLRKLDVWTQDIRLRMRMMGTLVAEAGGANVGGAFLSTLHAYTSNGDPFISSFSARLLQTLSVPFFATLSAWIYTGELHDPYDEFFVALNPALLGGAAGEAARHRARGAAGDDFGADRSVDAGVQPHELWARKFEFRKEMLPAFLTESFGLKIFSTGKSLNFMKYSCDDAAWVIERSRAEIRTLQYADMVDLERSIALAYSKASQRLFELFFDKFRLMDHLRTLKDYLMLGKGDFVEILMEQLGPSLGKPANTLYRHNLTSTLETAVRNSTPPSDVLTDVLRRLDARMLDFEQGQVGWDVFLLEYKVDAPLSTVLDPLALDSYRAMFKHLWEIKRVEYALNECWKTLMTKTRLLKQGSALAYDLHQARICLGEMVFFVRQVEYYCHLEVVACQWAELEDFVAKGEGDLDKLVDAHRKYLTKLADKALLKAQGRRKKEVKPLVEQLRDIWKVMLQWKNVADDLFAYAMQHESYARATSDTARSAPLHLRPPTAEQLEKLEDRLASYGTLFRERATELVVGLERSPDLDMKFLAVRLNFNYQFRTFRSLVSLCVRVRAYSGPADGQERAQDRIRRAQSRRRDRPLLVSLPSHTSVAVVLPRISADVPCVSSREAAESLMCSQGRSRSATPLGPLLGPAQARRPSLFRGRLWRAHARTEEKPRRFRELAPNSAP
ncbi:Spc98 family-domain-containing protein [Rhodotorula diobovata]|uniref:Spc98 family-domain-containing protein n=1 Tax=Rhodotorula diobovata TaxID=5288 RepID=A0A5C5G0V7_9BASI|nr:Spc98 family-domain-containing protein [Rhodotorula diobovata]